MNTCDRCGPSVYAPIIVSLTNGGTLTYCKHCLSIFRPKLEVEGAWIFDQNGKHMTVESLEACDHGPYATLMFGERECLTCGDVELPPLGESFVRGLPRNAERVPDLLPRTPQ